MDRYEARINLHGNTDRERYVNRLKQSILQKAPNNPSYKSVRLNGVETNLIINTGTKPYYKEFESLPGQTVLAGDYVEWKNQIWLVYDADCDDEVYIDGNLRQCQHKIYWQNSDGKILSRHVWTQNASAYNNGETGNNIITLQSNQFMVYMPYDEDTCILDNGLRIHMSKANNQTCKPYTLTRPDDITYGYGEKGVLNIIFTQTQFNAQSDKRVTLEDGSEVWICDYHSPTDTPSPPEPNETTVLCQIQGSKTLKIGYSKTYYVSFSDKDGNELVDVEFKCNIVSDFIVKQTLNGKTIKLQVDDEDSIGSSFLLSIIVSGTVVYEIEIFLISEI